MMVPCLKRRVADCLRHVRLQASLSFASFSEETSDFYSATDNRYDDAWSSSFKSSESAGMGVLRSNEADDIDVLVKNYTAPALAKSLREKELTLQRASLLVQQGSFDQLVALLKPYSRENVEERRRRRYSVDMTDKNEGFSRTDLQVIQRYLHRMPRYVSKSPAKRASVVIPLCHVNGVASILFQKRSEKVRTHKQQVCFPGGMVDEGVDTTIIQTSLREFEEEMGVSGDKVQVLGVLRCDWTEVANMTGVAVTPVVGFIGELNDLALQPNPEEVEYLFTVPISELLDDKKWSQRPFSTPVFSGGDSNNVIWGLTAYLLNKFLKDVLLKCSIGKDI